MVDEAGNREEAAPRDPFVDAVGERRARRLYGDDAVIAYHDVLHRRHTARVDVDDADGVDDDCAGARGRAWGALRLQRRSRPPERGASEHDERRRAHDDVARGGVVRHCGAWSGEMRGERFRELARRGGGTQGGATKQVRSGSPCALAHRVSDAPPATPSAPPPPHPTGHPPPSPPQPPAATGRSRRARRPPAHAMTRGSTSRAASPRDARRAW
jgi:hypothetical protein